MIYTFLELQNRLIYPTGETDATDLDTRLSTALKACINEELERVWYAHNWRFRRRATNITTVADYTTGTVSVTNGSATVTGAGTTWTSAMVGRRLIVGSDTVAYLITAVGGTTSLTLQNEYAGSTDSGLTYAICAFEYILPADVATIEQDSVRIPGNEPMKRIDRPRRYWESATSDSSGQPTHFYDAGFTDRSSMYTTGTVAIATSGETSTVTGTGTTWTDSHIGLSFYIPGEQRVYNVYSRASGTSIVIRPRYQNPSDGTGTLGAGASYEIGSVALPKIGLDPMPDDAYFIEVDPYLAQYRELVANNDVPEFPEKHGRQVFQIVKAAWYNYPSSTASEADARAEAVKAEAAVQEMLRDDAIARDVDQLAPDDRTLYYTYE